MPAPRRHRLPHLGLRLMGLMILDALVSVWVSLLFGDGYWPLAAMVIIITVGINYVVLKADAFPLRWISPGLAFMLLLSVYPIIYTVYISFTNFGTGHLLPKKQTIEVLEQRQFLPESGATYKYTIFRAGENQFALWLQPESGAGFLALPEGVTAAPQIGPLDENGVPTSVEGYTPLTRAQVVQALSALKDATFSANGKTAQLTSSLGVAAELEQRYVYVPATDSMLDRKTNTIYQADARNGFFVSEAGDFLIPGYQVNIGLSNYARFFTDPSFRGPLLLVFVWTFVFALVSVFLAFSLGLLIAIAFGRNMPGSKLIKGLLIIPFAVPNVITILVWRGMLNPLSGVISTTLADIFNQPVGWPPVFSDPFTVKVALILVNVWLAYPYFMLVSSGALQAIPTDMYEAASIFGANSWQQFRHLTLPMLLIAVGPLLIGSFIANFNSLNVVYLFNQGGPPMVGTATPAGHSDILISYVYRLAFAGGGGQDFGYASAISTIIFVILAFITLFQFRTMRTLEKVGENV
jgi:ABC-type sugar transport system permease subunit